MKPVLVLGGTGALGRQVCSELAASGLTFVNPKRGEFDPMASLATLVQKITQWQPSAVINCVALNGFDPCHRQWADALEINGFLPMRLAAVSAQLGLKTIHFSTEAVFACDTPGRSYSEVDVPRPLTQYGMTKHIGESALVQGAPRFHVVRLPLLFGPTNDAQVVGRLMRRLQHGDAVKAATDVFSTPLYTPDVARFAVNLLSKDVQAAPITHLTSGEMVSLYELLRALALPLGLDSMLAPVEAASFPSEVAKPRHGGLSSTVTPPFSYEESVRNYSSWLSTHSLPD